MPGCLPACCPSGAEVITDHPHNNVTDAIFQKIGVNLHQQPSHPLGIIKGAIHDYFDKQHPELFTKFDNLHPVVTAKAVSRGGRGGRDSSMNGKRRRHHRRSWAINGLEPGHVASAARCRPQVSALTGWVQPIPASPKIRGGV